MKSYERLSMRLSIHTEPLQRALGEGNDPSPPGRNVPLMFMVQTFLLCTPAVVRFWWSRPRRIPRCSNRPEEVVAHTKKAFCLRWAQSLLLCW